MSRKPLPPWKVGCVMFIACLLVLVGAFYIGLGLIWGKP